MNIIERLNEDLINQLSKLYSKTWFTPNRTINDINIMLKNSYLTLAFVENDQLIGFCRVISDGIYKAFIFDVIVHEDYQNRGIGKQIMNSLMNHESLIDVGHMELYCPEGITGFYKKLGFETRTSLLLRYTR
ncbi:MAG: GNAT family N-acetyltransferase [Spirochaetaceae bacterium]